MPLKKILIADDHAMTLKGIKLLLLDSFPHIEIVEARNGKEVITQFEEHKPDVLLIDYHMPEMSGFDAAHSLLKKDRDIKIILFTLYDTCPIVLNFLKIGGRGFIYKGSPNEQICEAVRVVYNGEYYFSSENENDIITWLETGMPDKIPKIKFTSLELAILIRLSKGMSNEKIACELTLSIRTVETYRYDLIRKTGVKNSLELIEFIFRNGIL